MSDPCLSPSPHSRSDPRSDGSSSGECEMPLVFTNAVHIAIDCGAADVLRLLLRYGVPPDRPGVPGSSSAAQQPTTATNAATRSTKLSPKVSPTGHCLDKKSSLTAGYTTSPRYSPRASPRGSPKCSPRSGSPRPLSPLASGGVHDADKRLRPTLVRQAGAEVLEERSRDMMKLNFRYDPENRPLNVWRDHGKRSPCDASADLKVEFELRKLRYRNDEDVRKRQITAPNYDEEVKKRETANEKLRRDIEEAMRIRDLDEKRKLKEQEEDAKRRVLEEEEEEDKDKFGSNSREELESISEVNPMTIPEDPSLEDEETNQEKRDGEDKKAVSRRVSWVPEVAEKSAGGSREKPAYKRRHSAIVRRAVVTFQRQRSFSLDSQQVRSSY